MLRQRTLRAARRTRQTGNREAEGRVRRRSRTCACCTHDPEPRFPAPSSGSPSSMGPAVAHLTFVDLRTRTSHNRSVVRRLFFAALLCALVWATSDRPAACPSEASAAAASSAPCPSATGGNTDSTDHQWNAQRPTSASAHESVWRSQLHHSELAGVPCPALFLAIDSGDAPDRRPSLTPLHLRRIPLLI
jgi:hypothetical protein